MNTSQDTNSTSNIPFAGTGDSPLSKLNDTSLSVVVYALSAVIVIAVAFLMLFPQVLRVEGGIDVSYLPQFHALLNSVCSALLVAGYIAVRRKSYNLHRGYMIAAFVFSSVFLVSYVVYHSQAPATKFGGEGIIRPIYFFILITHIVLAAGILPLALFTIARSWRGEFAKHKKIARITLPLWLYVTVTGVIVYLMMQPYYNQTPPLP